MNAALRNARALSAGQFAWDNATPEDSIGPKELMEEAIVEQIDTGDQAVIDACAEHCVQHLDEEMAFKLTAAMIRELAINGRWESLRGAIAQRSPALAEALKDVAWMIGKRQPEFVEQEAARRLAEQEKAA